MNTRLDPNRRSAIRDGALEALFELPERIGRYEIRGELGRGGMGVVYDGFDPSLSRRVAIKVIGAERLAESGLDERALHQRFEREMRATSRLFHPNLVAILDAGVAAVGAESRAYYLMERVDGESLELRLRRAGPLRRAEGLRIAAAIARGLAVVHAEGLVHRDLKPSNVLLPTFGEAKLTDFGLSRWRPDPLEDEAEKGILGSAHYLSPEQVTHARVDARADLFSLGALLVEMFTGTPPFGAASLSDHLARIVADPPDGLDRLDRDVRSLAEELLAKDPADRPESALEVAERLEALAAAGQRAERWRRVGRRTAFSTGLALTALTGLGLWAHQDLARLEAESHQRRRQLEVQLERGRALLPAFTALADPAARATPEERRAIRDEVTGLLNRIAVERRRHAEAAARVAARLEALPWSLFAGLLPERSGDAAPSSKDHPLSDPAGHLGSRQAAEVEEQLRLLKQELGVDARVLFVTPPAGETFEGFGTSLFERLDAAGAGPGSRGLLLLVDVAGGRSRIEVGYELEPHLFDALAGALAREHLLRFEGDRLALDLRLVLRVVRLRLESALLAGNFPPPPGAGGFAAGGAGATAFSGEPHGVLSGSLDPDARLRYAAGASVRETYDRYLDWLQQGDFDVSVGIFTDASRTLLSRWRASPVYLDQMARSHPLGPVEVVERGDVAMLYALSDPLAPPHFFARAAAGWQIDLAARKRHVVAIAGGEFTWTLRRIGSRPLALFQPELAPVEGLIRIRRGANRPLPTGARLARLGS